MTLETNLFALQPSPGHETSLTKAVQSLVLGTLVLQALALEALALLALAQEALALEALALKALLLEVLAPEPGRDLDFPTSFWHSGAASLFESGVSPALTGGAFFSDVHNDRCSF